LQSFSLRKSAGKPNVRSGEIDVDDGFCQSETKPDVDALRPYYEELIAEFFPAEIRW
jgi:hypothetical protein